MSKQTFDFSEALRRMKKKYSFANAKPVSIGKLDYWARVGQCGHDGPENKYNLKDKRKHHRQ